MISCQKDFERFFEKVEKDLLNSENNPRKWNVKQEFPDFDGGSDRIRTIVTMATNHRLYTILEGVCNEYDKTLLVHFKRINSEQITEELPEISVEKAIEILAQSNQRLVEYMNKLEACKTKAVDSGLEDDYYSVLANDRNEYTAVKLAIKALQSTLNHGC